MAKASEMAPPAAIDTEHTLLGAILLDYVEITEALNKKWDSASSMSLPNPLRTDFESLRPPIPPLRHQRAALGLTSVFYAISFRLRSDASSRGGRYHTAKLTWCQGGTHKNSVSQTGEPPGYQGEAKWEADVSRSDSKLLGGPLPK